MTELPPSPRSDAGADGVTLRLLWPQWQGAGTSSVQQHAPEFPFDVARRGYAVGSAVLAAVLPANQGPTVAAPVAMDDAGLELADGIEAKEVILTQLARAFEVIRQYDPARIVTLGGECAVSVAPFSALARRYGDDLAIVWIDSHPDAGTPASQYPGFHAMAVATLTGHGHPEVQALLSATVAPDRVALVGLHSWAEDDIANVAHWGICSFSPADLGGTTQPLLDWLAATGCARVAIHFDVDTIDSNEIVLGLGAEPGGLTSAQVRRIVGDIDSSAEVVGITVAEFIPRQVMHLQQLLATFPLLRASRSRSASGLASQGGDSTVTERPRTRRPTVKRAEGRPPRPGTRPVRSGSQLDRCDGRDAAKHASVPLRRVCTGEVRCEEILYELKAGPVGGRLRRPSSAGAAAGRPRR